MIFLEQKSRTLSRWAFVVLFAILRLTVVVSKPQRIFPLFVLLLSFLSSPRFSAQKLVSSGLGIDQQDRPPEASPRDIAMVDRLLDDADGGAGAAGAHGAMFAAAANGGPERAAPASDVEGVRVFELFFSSLDLLLCVEAAQ